MTVYARSDVCYVGISSDHGGCGEGHSRPVIDGAPTKLWALTCHNGCEDYLRNDSLWATKPHAIPETPDEVVVREDVEKRGHVEQAEATSHALTNLARLGELPQHLAQALALALAPLVNGQTPALTAEPSLTVLCRNGHAGNGPLASFCGTCGVGLNEPVPSDRGPELEAFAPEAEAVVESDLKPTEPADEAEVDLNPEKLAELPLADLRVIADKLGVRGGRSKAEQLDLILEKLAKS